MWIKEVESGMLLQLFTFAFSVLNFSFLPTLSSTTSLYFVTSTVTAVNLPIPKSSTFVFKLFKLVGTLIIQLMSSLTTSAFKATKSFF